MWCVVTFICVYYLFYILEIVMHAPVMSFLVSFSKVSLILIMQKHILERVYF